MSFKDSLKKVNFSIDGKNFEAIGASFRGWPFFVDGSSVSGGRRIVVHELPLRNQPIIEDLGKKQRAYTLDGYVLGHDYTTQRDALKTALEATGPGELIHPYYGLKNVQISDYSISETSSEGGFAKFSISFIEVEKFIQGDLESAVRADAVLLAAQEIGDNSQTFLESVFEMAGLAQDLVDKVLDSVDKAIKNVETAKAQVRKIAEFKNSIDRVFVNLENLVSNIKGLGQNLRDLVNFEGVTSDEQDVLDRSGALISFDPKSAIYGNLFIAQSNAQENANTPNGTTPQTTQANNNIKSMANFMQCVAFENAAKMIVDANFTSVSEAEFARDSMAESFEYFLLNIDDDTLYQNAQNLQIAIDRLLDAQSANLRNIIEHTPIATISSLALAFDLYENQDEEADILSRNKIRNPLFLLPNKTLEVLTRV